VTNQNVEQPDTVDAAFYSLRVNYFTQTFMENGIAYKSVTLTLIGSKTIENYIKGVIHSTLGHKIQYQDSLIEYQVSKSLTSVCIAVLAERNSQISAFLLSKLE
jgi:hypothetical protein